MQHCAELQMSLVQTSSSAKEAPVTTPRVIWNKKISDRLQCTSPFLTRCFSESVH